MNVILDKRDFEILENHSGPVYCRLRVQGTNPENGHAIIGHIEGEFEDVTVGVGKLIKKLH